MNSVKERYIHAKIKYKEIGIDTDTALQELREIIFSLKCCDIVDIYNRSETSDYKNEKENSPKLRAALGKALSLIPGKHRISLNAVHMDSEEIVELDEIEACHYDKWIEWAKKNTSGLDFYTSMVRHEKSDGGFALSNRNKDFRYFWIENCQRCRIVGKHIGKEMKGPCRTTININDFYESIPVETMPALQLLTDSLNKIYSEKINKNYNQDSVFTGLEGKKEGYMPVADEDFCSKYAVENNIHINLSSRNFKSEGDIYQQICTAQLFSEKIVVNIQPEHSETMILLNDKLKNMARCIVNNSLLEKTYICLDFKTSVDDLSKIKKWVLGTRAVEKAFLLALLEPSEYLKRCYEAGDYNSQKALEEEFKTYPFGAVWDYFCEMMNVPVGLEWLEAGSHLS